MGGRNKSEIQDHSRGYLYEPINDDSEKEASRGYILRQRKTWIPKGHSKKGITLNLPMDNVRNKPGTILNG